MNIEHIKIEPEYSVINEENSKYQVECNNIEPKTEVVEDQITECVLLGDVRDRSQNSLNIYECRNDGLLQLIETQPYSEIIERDCFEDRREDLNEHKTNNNDDNVDFSLDYDSFNIIYLNNDRDPNDVDVTEDITIISCDPVDLSLNKTQDKQGKVIPEIIWHKCEICQFKTSKPKIYEKHVNAHIGLDKMETAKCHLCNFRSIYPNNLKKHLLRHESKKAFYCNLCSYKANLKDALHDHMKNVHLKDDVNQSGLYRCPDCDYATKHVSNYKRHLKSCQDKLLACRFCEFKTLFKHKFVEHSLCHNKVEFNSLEVIENAIYQCEICKFETTRANSLKKHDEKYHPVETNGVYKANSSNQKFKVIKANDIKVYQCEECGHSTTDPSNFNRHLKSHRKNDCVSLFECYSCGLKTKYKVNLVKHVNKHRSEGKMRR